MNWFFSNPLIIFPIFIKVAGLLAAIIVLTRLNGLRTFSKMSSYDFAVTVAFGSIIASTALSSGPSLTEGVLALGALVVCQWGVSWLRRQRGADRIVDNAPVVLMVGGEFFEDELDKTRVTKEDIYAKLREANVLDYSEVKAVVLESTGDVSVLHAADKTLNPELLTGVRNAHRIST